MSTHTTTSTLADETRTTTSTTHTVAPGITLTVTGQPGQWKVWETDAAGELRYVGTSTRQKADSAASDVHDRVTDEKIAAAGLQDMARADRQAAADLAARKETTQALWDALRAAVPPATTPEPVNGKATGGKKRRQRGGRGRGHGRNRNTTTIATTTTTGTASPAKPRQRQRKAAQPRAATVAAKSTTEASTPTSQRRSTRPSRRERREGALAASVASVETAIAAAVTPVVAAAVTVAEPVVAVAAPPAPTRTTQVARTVAPPAAVPDRTVDEGDDDVVEAQWAVYVQVDEHDGQPANLVGDVGRLGDALSASLRTVLGDRDAGRVRKSMRAGGLITGPTVYQAPAPRALRVAAAPLNSDDAATLLALKPGVLADRVKAVVDAKTARTKARPLASR